MHRKNPIMKIPSLIIVADRGHLQAYAIDRSARAPTPRLIDSKDFSEGLQKLSEQVTDKAGGFPNTGSGGYANAAAERMTLTAELEMRSFRHAAERIASLLREHRPDAWAFAAPSEINRAILDGLHPTLRDRLAQNLPLDLINVPADELLGHFARAEA